MVGEALDLPKIRTTYTDPKREHNRIDVALRRTHPILAREGMVLYSAVNCRLEFPKWIVADKVPRECLSTVTRYVIEHGADRIRTDVQQWIDTYRGRRVPAKPPVSVRESGY